MREKDAIFWTVISGVYVHDSTFQGYERPMKNIYDLNGGRVQSLSIRQKKKRCNGMIESASPTKLSVSRVPIRVWGGYAAPILLQCIIVILIFSGFTVNASANGPICITCPFFPNANSVDEDLQSFKVEASQQIFHSFFLVNRICE